MKKEQEINFIPYRALDFHNPYANDLYVEESYISKPTYKGGIKKHYGVIKPVRTEPKINRNSVCNCGSGKKYKKCCLK